VLRETTESEKTEEVDTFPCEFCLKSFPRSDLDNHMVLVITSNNLFDKLNFYTKCIFTHLVE